MTEFGSPEVRKDGYKRLILSWIRICLGGGLVARALASKARGPGSNPGQG